MAQTGDRQKWAAWLTALERRHLADLRVPEVARALRALSSAYVERRARGEGQHVRGALDTAGKRAAFALFYAPLHFIAVTEVVRALAADGAAPASITDLGCGTGVAGAAWALATGSTGPVAGIDRHPWAVTETRWTYEQLGVRGRARQGEIARWRPAADGGVIIAAYVLNELPEAERRLVEDRLLAVARQGGRVLVLEPLARGVAPWWDEATARVTSLGGRADEWRLAVEAPPIVARLGEAAGLDCREVKLRSLFV